MKHRPGAAHNILEALQFFPAFPANGILHRGALHRTRILLHIIHEFSLYDTCLWKAGLQSKTGASRPIFPTRFPANLLVLNGPATQTFAVTVYSSWNCKQPGHIATRSVLQERAISPEISPKNGLDRLESDGHKMQYLVTGGAGFIGGFLCERLIAEGHHVTVLDNMSTGKYDNVAHLDGQERFRLIIDSVTNERLAEDLVRGCDAIVHLASAVGVKLIMDRPVQVIETIFQGTDTILRLASRYRKLVMITSSSEVYGKSENVPFREDGDRLEGPTSKHRWAYACAKALDEFLALAHWKETRLPVICVRLFNTVGPRQTGQYGMVVPRFVQAALSGESLIVHGDGKQSRCFCHVEDVVEALVGLLSCKAAHGLVVNVGTDQEISILDLANQIIATTQSKSTIKHISYDAAFGEGFEDMRRRVPSLERIHQLIGWRPKRNLDTIIRDVALTIRSSMPSNGS